MVPTLVIELDALPLTHNGKIDRKALPAPAGAALGRETSYAHPRNDLERQLVEIWRTFLPVTRVSIDDAFFDIGGHSLLLVRVHARIREQIAPVPLIALFEHPTIRRLAKHLGGSHEQAQPPPLRRQRMRKVDLGAATKRGVTEGEQRQAP